MYKTFSQFYATIWHLTANVDIVLNQSGGNEAQNCVYTEDNATPNLENPKRLSGKNKYQQEVRHLGKSLQNRRTQIGNTEAVLSCNPFIPDIRMFIYCVE